VSAASDAPERPRVSLQSAPDGDPEFTKSSNGGAAVDIFLRNGMNVIGVLLLFVIASAVYTLWDVAIERWFG
jgi:hypothetical protein